jgi:hypothetical protein
MTMTQQMLQHMRSYMNETSKKAAYTLQELRNDGIVYSSYFDNKNKAKAYARKYCDDSSSIYIYKTYCIKIYDPVDDIHQQEDEKTVDEYDYQDVDYSPENDLSNMTLWKYGSGYLLVAPEDSEYFGNKYFHEGWWIKSQNGWFFKRQHYQWLIDSGAIISEEHEEDIEYSTDLSKMTLWSYGKGYILEPSEDNEYYGEKYFHSGWWIPKQNGWFFKAEEYNWLVENGAKLSEQDEDEDAVVEEDDQDDVELGTMTLRSYGKGYLLIPTKTDSHYGDKYFHDGWWMPKQRGWFFKAEFYDWLVEHGVKSVKSVKSVKTSNKTELSEYAVDLSNMSLSEYGRGYILHTTESDTRFGQKYFMTGFWNTKQNGWFFKTEYFDELVTMGAKFIKPEPEQANSLFDSTELSSSITNDSFEYVHDDSEFMTNDNKAVPKFEKYGKGWILKQDKHYKHNGNDYFEGGWWIPSIKAWFFKKTDKQKFMMKHFEI